MKLPDAVIDKLQDGDSPVTHAAIIDSGEMIIRYTCDGKVIGQTMFHYTPETYVDWFRSIMNEMNPGTGDSTTKNKVKVRDKRKPRRASQSHRPHSRKRESRRHGGNLRGLGVRVAIPQPIRRPLAEPNTYGTVRAPKISGA